MTRIALALLATAACAAPAPHRRPPVPTTTVAPSTTSPATTTTAPPAVTTSSVRVTTTTGAATVAEPPEGNEGAMEQQLAAIARCEGYPRYVNAEHPGSSSASGKYGALRGTWGGYGGYDTAAEAPESVQDEWARELYARAGSTPWRASRGCWGRG